MDKELLTYVLDQAVGVVIAVILLTRIERRLDTLIKRSWPSSMASNYGRRKEDGDVNGRCKQLAAGFG